MNKDRILVPFDFTDASENAVATAIDIALKKDMAITLLHINDQSVTDSDSKLKFYINMLELPPQITVDHILKQGNAVEEVTTLSKAHFFNLMVIGSHGYKGLREKIVGADILKLVREISFPVFVIRKNYKIPENNVRNIILPISQGNSFQFSINASLGFATNFKSEFHIIYDSSGEKNKLYSDNIELAVKTFDSNNIQYRKKEFTAHHGHHKSADQILSYSGSFQNPVISVLSDIVGDENCFSKKELEHLLTNESDIPVLCCK